MTQSYDYYDLTGFQRMVMKISNTYFICRMIISMNKMIDNTRISGVYISRFWYYLLCTDKIRKLN